MTDGQIFTSRLRGRPLLDKEDRTIGRIRDVVILPSVGADPPRALGLVVTLQRRRIFVNLAQVTEISVDGAHLPGGTVELERFSRKTGEIMASELYGRHTPDGSIADVAISPSQRRRDGWEVSALALSHGRALLGGAVELDRFTRRTGEMLASGLYGRHSEDGTIVDVAISPSEYQRAGWEVSARPPSRTA